MLDKRRIRLMTKLAIYEKKEGREDIRLSRYYSSDYARLQVLKTAITITFSYIFILIFVGLYRLEYLLDNALTLDYKAMGWQILGVYIAIMAVYLICTLLGYSLKYKASRRKLAGYFKQLHRLDELYREADGDDTEEGEE